MPRVGFFIAQTTPAITGAATCRLVALLYGQSARACPMLNCEPYQYAPRS